jgi:GGDEF domain-containing protein
VKHKAASSRGERAAQDPARSKPQRHAADAADAKTGPLHAAKSRAGSAAARLAAVERLSAELAASRLRIGELENRIDVDPLTQTFNRGGFEGALTRSLAYVKRYQAAAALVYLDLDEFKPVNDRHGHAAGDAVLKAVSAALQREVRASDIVARIGGDEFAVLLWNMTEADARQSGGSGKGDLRDAGAVGRVHHGGRRLGGRYPYRCARHSCRGARTRRYRHVRPQDAAQAEPLAPVCRASKLSGRDRVGRHAALVAETTVRAVSLGTRRALRA